MIKRFFITSVLAGALMAGCTIGPEYKKPLVPTPPDFGWKLAEPKDQAIKGDWWRLFHDATLDGLESQATAANQQLRVALAHVDQSRAVARITKSRFYPEASFDPSIKTFHTPKDAVPSQLSATAFTAPLDFSYEIDLWGKIRRAFEGATDQAQATAADYYNVLLTLHGDVAVDYFFLRELDAQTVLLRQTAGLREKSVRILTERFQAGLAPQLDLDRAQAEWAQTKTQVTETERQRDVLQNALALLCGRPASTFRIEPGTLDQAVPAVPVGLPSALLERRPDIAEAERKMAAANAQIGVARAAFFPALRVTGDAGYSSFTAASLLTWESRLFHIGPAVTLPLLNGGRLKAGVKEARAGYEAACASYQQQVLVAFKDVSDSLTDLNSYSQQSVTELEAVTAADRAANLSAQRYKRGLINYLDVLDAERTQLQAQVQALQIRGLQLAATVHLIKGLGGGFEAETLSISPNKS